MGLSAHVRACFFVVVAVAGGCGGVSGEVTLERDAGPAPDAYAGERPPDVTAKYEAGAPDAAPPEAGLPDVDLPDVDLPDVDAADADLPDAPGPLWVPVHGAEICRLEWPQPVGLDVGPIQMVTDAQGDTYLVLGHFNPDADPTDAYLQLGATQVPNLYGTAVVKVDDDCHLVWVRDYSGFVAGAALATDAQSNLTIFGMFGGTADLGAGPVSTPDPSGMEPFLLRLDANGDVVFSKVFASQEVNPPLPWPSGLALGPDGSSYISMYAAPDTDFGGGVDAGDVEANAVGSYFFVRLDASGNQVFRKTSAQVSSAIQGIGLLASDSAGDMWGSADLLPPATQNGLAGISLDGGVTWTQSPGVITSMTANDGGLVALYQVQDAAVALQAFAPDGISPWTNLVPEFNYDPDVVVVDALGRATTGGTVLPTDEATGISAGKVAALPTAGNRDVGFQAFDAHGQIVSQGSWGGPGDDWLGGVGVDPAGNVLLAGSSDSPTQGSPGDDFLESLFFVKLTR